MATVLAVTIAPTAFAAPKSVEHATSDTKQIAVVTGLDGATYEAYLPSTIKQVQQALKDKGMYSGEVNGVLDKATMDAVAEFQKQNHIEASGVPSPDTRDLLLNKK
jgi:peptidoglycan hydrolase-like protein with peptidoglycan-binding domain